MKSTLNQKDRDILFKSQYADLNFGTYSDDYVQALLYDTNDNLIETSVVESSDYTIEDGSVKLKTGTIIRKMGYDRGRYRIKYNFLRKKAGSYETVLVDSNNQIYNGPYHVMENGHIMKGADHVHGAERLFLKENKYLIQEVSPSRNEVRVIPQNIDDKKYIDDLFYSGKKRKKEKVDFSVNFVTANPGVGSETLKDSVELKSSEDLPQSYVGSLIYLNKAFIKEKIFPQPEPDPSTIPENETVGDIQARFYISNTDGTILKGGNLSSINTIWNDFKDATDDTINTVKSQQQNYNNVTYMIRKYSAPIFQKDGGEIELKSISTKPAENLPVKYTWTISGQDFTRKGYLDNPIAAGNDDAYIVEAGSGNVSYQTESANGSSIKVRWNSSTTFINVQLKIESKLANNNDVSSTVFVPYTINVEKN